MIEAHGGNLAVVVLDPIPSHIGLVPAAAEYPADGVIYAATTIFRRSTSLCCRGILSQGHLTGNGPIHVGTLFCAELALLAGSVTLLASGLGIVRSFDGSRNRPPRPLQAPRQ
ncbi:hypothetical protein ACF1BQ_029865 [Bradyrhizobium sp. RDT10]